MWILMFNVDLKKLIDLKSFLILIVSNFEAIPFSKSFFFFFIAFLHMTKFKLEVDIIIVSFRCI